MATRETTGDPATRRGASDPERRAEWTTVLRNGHLQSATVAVDDGFRTEREPPPLRAALRVSTRPTRAPPRWPLASPRRENHVDDVPRSSVVGRFSLVREPLQLTLRRVLCCGTGPGSRETTGELTTGRRSRDGRWWDAGRVRPKRALVQAFAVALHDTGWGSRVRLPLAQPLRGRQTFDDVTAAQDHSCSESLSLQIRW